jgi:hypothetical protein
VVSGIEFQASQVIERLEEAVEKAEDGDGGPAAGQSWKNSHAFLPLPSKTTEEILSLLEVLTFTVVAMILCHKMVIKVSKYTCQFLVTCARIRNFCWECYVNER